MDGKEHDASVCDFVSSSSQLSKTERVLLSAEACLSILHSYLSSDLLKDAGIAEHAFVGFDVFLGADKARLSSQTRQQLLLQRQTPCKWKLKSKNLKLAAAASYDTKCDCMLMHFSSSGGRKFLA